MSKNLELKKIIYELENVIEEYKLLLKSSHDGMCHYENKKCSHCGCYTTLEQINSDPELTKIREKRVKDRALNKLLYLEYKTKFISEIQAIIT